MPQENPISEILGNISGGTSASTDKLALLMGGLGQIPPEQWAKAKKMNIQWEQIDDEILPTIELEFYDGTSQKKVPQE